MSAQRKARLSNQLRGADLTLFDEGRLETESGPGPGTETSPEKDDNYPGTWNCGAWFLLYSPIASIPSEVLHSTGIVSVETSIRTGLRQRQGHSHDKPDHPSDVVRTCGRFPGRVASFSHTSARGWPGSARALLCTALRSCDKFHFHFKQRLRCRAAIFHIGVRHGHNAGVRKSYAQGVISP